MGQGHKQIPANQKKSQGTRSQGTVQVRAEEEGETRTRVLSFSSQEPYRRFFGPEILDHSEGAVDLTRLSEIGVLLFNHNTDTVIGKVNRVWVEEERGMAEVEFDTDQEAERIFSKVSSGTLKATSVRYSVETWEEVSTGGTSADGKYTGPCSIARKWTPMEISIVSVPADASVGVGRSEDWAEEPIDLAYYQRQIQINKNRTGGT